MAEESWHEARLIPTSGINGPDEQERRATSALLAVIGAVPEYGRSLLRDLGAPTGRIETYIEVPFLLEERRLFPDGLIRITRGSRVWVALVEVKTGKNELGLDQVTNYLDIARENKFDAVITISNEIPAARGQHPLSVDKRRLRAVALHHLSWTDVLATAVVQKEFRGVSDPDQAWILGELIRYLEHPRSGALEFDDMGEEWTQVRDAIAAGTLRTGDKKIPEVCSRFDALLRFVGLSLGRRLGSEVRPALSRKEVANPELRGASLAEQITRHGILTGAIHIPGTVGDLCIDVDLRSNKIRCHCAIDAPRTGRPSTRVNWLLRQLSEAPDTTQVEGFVLHGRGSGAIELLGPLRSNPKGLGIDQGKDLRSFRVALSFPMGQKRGRGRGAFIDSVAMAVDQFYEQVLQQLKAWSIPPPKLRQEQDLVSLPSDLRSSLSSTALSSQDEIDPTSGDERGLKEPPESDEEPGADVPGAATGDHHPSESPVSYQGFSQHPEVGPPPQDRSQHGADSAAHSQDREDS